MGNFEDRMDEEPFRYKRKQWHVTTIHEGMGGSYETKKQAIQWARVLKQKGEEFAIWEQNKLRSDIVV